MPNARSSIVNPSRSARRGSTRAANRNRAKRFSVLKVASRSLTPVPRATGATAGGAVVGRRGRAAWRSERGSPEGLTVHPVDGRERRDGGPRQLGDGAGGVPERE